MTTEKIVEMLKKVKLACEYAANSYCSCWDSISHNGDCVLPFFKDIAEALEGLDEGIS